MVTFFSIAALAIATLPMPRIDTTGASIDWLSGVVHGEGLAEPCVVTGKSMHECQFSGTPSARVAERDALFAALRLIMTFPVVDECVGYEALQRRPELRALVRTKATTSSRQIDAQAWRGEAVVVLDVELIRAFKNACEQALAEAAVTPPHLPKVFSGEDEKRLLLEVERELRSFRTAKERQRSR